jgi:hypothetical protein
MAESEIEKLHRQVNARVEQWQRIADVLAGPDAVKSESRRETYLPRLPGQRRIIVQEYGAVDEYANYVSRAVLASAQAQRVLTGLCGMVFRKPTKFEVPDVMLPDLDNWSLDGLSADAFCKRLLREALSTGFGVILVDYDDLIGRPYVRLFQAQSVLNWRVQVVGGRPVLTQLVVREAVEEPGPFGSHTVDQIRVIELRAPEGQSLGPDYPLGVCVHQPYRKMADSSTEDWVPWGDPVIPMRTGSPLGFVPAIPFNSSNATWECAKPPMLELVDLILAHYRNSADYENTLHFAGAGHTLFLSGMNPGDEDKIRVGGSSAIVTSSTGADAKWVTTGGSGGQELLEAMRAKEQAMGVAMARLLLSPERRVAETAESQRVAFAGDDATLSDVVTAIEEATENALAIHVWWSSTIPTVEDAYSLVEVRLNRDFIENALDANQLTTLGLEVDAGRMSKRRQYYLAQRGELTEPGISFEDEAAQIDRERGVSTSLAPDNGGDIAPAPDGMGDPAE